MSSDVRQLNAELRAEIAAIDRMQGPLRVRVAQASERIIRIIMPRSDDPRDRRARDLEPRSLLVFHAKAPPATAHDAQAGVLAEFSRSLLETDFRQEMAKDGAYPFSYLVRCVHNRAVELWRQERALDRRHDIAANDAAIAPELTVDDEVSGDREEMAAKLAEIAQRVPAALQMLERDELLLLLLSAVLRLQRDRIGEVIGTTSNTVGQKLLRLRDHLHALIHGCPRRPDPSRVRGGRASAQKQAASRARREANGHNDVRNVTDTPSLSSGEQVFKRGEEA